MKLTKVATTLTLSVPKEQAMKRRQDANGASSTPGGRPAPAGAPGAANSRANEFDSIDNKNKDGPTNVEMKDIDINLRGEEAKQEEGIGPGPAQARDLQKQSTDDEDEEQDLDGYDDEHLPFFSQIVNRYPKSIDWYFMVVSFCAMRAATPFGIAMAYLILIGKAVQLVGTFVNKPVVAYAGYGASAFMLTILFFVAMANEAD
jgi:hypothetical protein